MNFVTAVAVAAGTHCANRYREKTSTAVIIALLPPDGSSKGTMSICKASSGYDAIFDVSIIGGGRCFEAILLFSRHCRHWLTLSRISLDSPG